MPVDGKASDGFCFLHIFNLSIIALSLRGSEKGLFPFCGLLLSPILFPYPIWEKTHSYRMRSYGQAQFYIH